MSLHLCQTVERHFLLFEVQKKKGESIMFQKKYQEVLFTLLTSGLMIFCMGLYNVALHTGGLQWNTFAITARSFPLEWIIGYLCALFLAGRIAPKLAFRVARPGDRSIFIILCIQTFTVCVMVPLMSLLGALESGGITADLPVRWIQTVVVNFLVAYPLQVFLIGPICRSIFRRTCGAFP